MMFPIIVLSLVLCAVSAQAFQVFKSNNGEELNFITQLCFLLAICIGWTIVYPLTQAEDATAYIVGVLYILSTVVSGLSTATTLTIKLRDRPTAGNVQRKAEEVLSFFADLSAEQKVKFVSVAKLISERSFNYVAFLKYALSSIRGH